MNVPRKHHYIPEFYLKGFAPRGLQDNQLNVLDCGSGAEFGTNPGKIARETDFYLLESNQPDPFAIESFFATIEGHAKSVIESVVKTSEMPAGDDYLKLMDFLSIMSVRIPGWLDQVDAFTQQVLKTATWYMVADKEQWQELVDKSTPKRNMKQASELTQEKMLEFIESNDYSITMNQNSRMELLLKAIETARMILPRRNWTLVKAAAHTKGFICSDRPLSVCWNDPKDKGWIPPALGMPATSVQFPLDQNTALIGIFESPLPTRVLDSRGVGIFNMWTGLFAKRFIFGPNSEFEVTKQDGMVGGKTDLLMMRQQRVDHKPKVGG